MQSNAKHGQACGRSGTRAAGALATHHVDELSEADIAIMGSRRSFWMVLNAQHIQCRGEHTGTCAIIQIDVCDLDIFWQRGGIDCIIVILSADLNATCAPNVRQMVVMHCRSAGSSLCLLDYRVCHGNPKPTQ